MGLLDRLRRQRAASLAAFGMEGLVEAFEAFDCQPADPDGAEVW